MSIQLTEAINSEQLEGRRGCLGKACLIDTLCKRIGNEYIVLQILSKALEYAIPSVNQRSCMSISAVRLSQHNPGQ